MSRLDFIWLLFLILRGFFIKFYKWQQSQKIKDVEKCNEETEKRNNQNKNCYGSFPFFFEHKAQQHFL
jgi:hypothetical protein